MKIGNFEIVWTRRWIIAASIGAVFLLGAIGALIPNSNNGPTEPPEAVPPYPTTINAQLPPDSKKQVDALSRGAMEFVFFHETGHMLISELNLPAIGPEEDVADEFATFYLTNMMKNSPDNMKDSIAMTIYAGAMFWRIASQNSDMRNYPWYDEHSPDQRRYYNIICIATGADPLRFIPLAVKDGVPQSRLNKCADEYKKKLAAWNELMGPHLRGYFERKFSSGGHLKLQVGSVEKAEWLPFELTYRQGGYFQQMLNGMNDDFKLPEDVPVIIKSCNGVVNAWWSPDTKTITLCHEMFQTLVDTFEKAVAEQLQQQQQAQNMRAAGTTGEQPGPQPGGGGQQQPPAPQSAANGGEGQDFGVPPKAALESNVGSPTPTSIPGGYVVTTRQLARALQQGSRILLIDALNDGGRGHASLPGAQHLGFAGQGGSFRDRAERQLSLALAQLTGNQRNIPIVFFCAGPICWESYNAALRAEYLGYTNVGWYRGGLQAWQTNGLPLR